MMTNKMEPIEIIVEKFKNGELRAKKMGLGFSIEGPNMPEIVISRAQDFTGPSEAIYRICLPSKDNYPGYYVFLGPNGVIPYKEK